MTAKAAVVGWPIQHSLSPVLHGHWLKQYDIDGTYEKIAIEPGTFAQRIAELRAAGYRGVNVTVPFKEEAFAIAEEPKMAAKIASAANLLAFGTDGRIHADNTDGFGLQHSLRQELGNSWGGKRVVLLGAGGAARGGVLALNALRVTEIHILNRNAERAEILASNLSTALRAVQEPHHIPTPMITGGGMGNWEVAARGAALVVNTTSAGMKGSAPLDLDLTALPKSAAVCDIVYNPLETDLLKRAKERGHVTVDGLGMLMHQAAPSFKVFFGQFPEVTPQLRTALIEALQVRG